MFRVTEMNLFVSSPLLSMHDEFIMYQLLPFVIISASTMVSIILVIKAWATS